MKPKGPPLLDLGKPGGVSNPVPGIWPRNWGKWLEFRLPMLKTLFIPGRSRLGAELLPLSNTRVTLFAVNGNNFFVGVAKKPANGYNKGG